MSTTNFPNPPKDERILFSLAPTRSDSDHPRSLIPPNLYESVRVSSFPNVSDEKPVSIQNASPANFDYVAETNLNAPVPDRQLAFARPEKSTPREAVPKNPPVSVPCQQNIEPTTPTGTTKMQVLYSQLAPVVAGKLVFADGEAYLQHRNRVNTYKKLARIELIDKLRMLLPAEDRARYGKGVFEDVIAVLRAELDVGPAESAFNAHSGLVNARNGVVCVSDGDPYLIKDDPDIRFTYALDADFLP